MTIHHLVLTGGGASGFITYGVLRELTIQGYLNIAEIKSIYGTSIGAILAVIFSLNYDWETLDDYLIKRPWENIVDIGPEELWQGIKENGLIGEEFIVRIIEPLFRAKDISIDITLDDFYKKTNIELHMFAIDINDSPLKLTDFSHKTFPTMRLIDALRASSALPFLFQPFFYKDSCYIDGGLLSNFPIMECLEDNKNEKEILAIQNIYANSKTALITPQSNMGQFMRTFGCKIWDLIHEQKEEKEKEIKNIVECPLQTEWNPGNWMDQLTKQEKRKEFIDYGKECADKYLLEHGLEELH